MSSGLNLTPGIRHEKLESGSDLYTIATVKPVEIRNWLDDMVKTFRDSGATQYRLIYDFSSVSIFVLQAQFRGKHEFDPTSIGLTLEHNNIFQEILASKLHWDVRLAVVFKQSLSAQVNRIMAIKHNYYATKFFMTVDAADKWLVSPLIDIPRRMDITKE